ncbi:MAG: Tm-1-like ATP-binding domain-containing protein [Pseudomonadota bacterium]
MAIQPDRNQAWPASSARLSPGIVIASTLDAKSAEVALLCGELRQQGMNPLVIDCGVLGDPQFQPDISAHEIARLAGAELQDLRSRRDRAVSLPIMLRGLSECIALLVAQGLVQGYVCIGGGTNAALATVALQHIPLGIPKLIVSTTVSGDTRQLVGYKDVVLVHSVVDILGTGSYLRALLARTARLMRTLLDEPPRAARPEGSIRVGVTAFGSTTPAANALFELLTALHCDVLTFHARGTGGLAMEQFISSGELDAVIDLTTTEISDEVVGGLCTAGPLRLDAAADRGLPQVLLPGAIDMVNFGGQDTVPARFAGRNLIRHTPTTTLMRTSADETAEVARFMARKLSRATAPFAVIIPTRGFSAYDVEGGPFFDPAADAVFGRVLRSELAGTGLVIDIDAHINNPAVAALAVRTLTDLIATHRRS